MSKPCLVEKLRKVFPIRPCNQATGSLGFLAKLVLTLQMPTVLSIMSKKELKLY
jgi:hypothetical protein